MEINKKLRGQKHHYNKARYQNKAKIVPKSTPEKTDTNKNKDSSKESIESERGLTSNWHRYEELPEDNQVDESTNFSLLAQAPISHGGHFQFKSDKNVVSEFDFESLRNNKMFELDLCLLQTSLSTIPFYDRCDLDQSYFTDNQLQEIHQRTHQNKAQYESFLRINSIAKEFLPHSIENKESGKNITHSFKSTNDYDSEISSVTTTNVTEGVQGCQKESEAARTTNTQNNVTENKEELEQWLDDILND